MIKTVVKVTLAQFRVLEAGGTVGAHTYDPDHCLYLIDDGLVLPQDSGRYFIRTDDDGETYYYDEFNYSTIGTVAAGTSAITSSVSSSSLNSQIPTALAVYNALALAPGISTVTISGSGNAVTGVTYDSSSHELTVSKGSFATSGHTHTTGITAVSSGSNITFGFGSTYVISAGGTAYTFSMMAKPSYSWSDISSKPTLSVNGQVVTIGNNSVTVPTQLAWSAITGKPTLSVSGQTVTIGNNSVTVPTQMAWTAITGKPTLSISGNTITIGNNSTTWTNTVGLSWDATNHAVKSSTDNTSATIPTATTSTQGIIAIGTAATQAAAGNHSHTLDDVSDGSTRKLSNYLPLTGGTLTNTTAPQLILSNSGGGKCGLKFSRNNNTAWELYIETGNFYIKDLNSNTIALRINESSQYSGNYNRPLVYGNKLAYLSDIPTTISWDNVTSKPSTFTPSSHNHPLSEVTGWSTIGTVAAGTSAITTTISSSSSTKIVTEGGIKTYVDNHTGLDKAALKVALNQAMTVTTNSAGSNTLVIDINAIT